MTQLMFQKYHNHHQNDNEHIPLTLVLLLQNHYVHQNHNVHDKLHLHVHHKHNHHHKHNFHCKLLNQYHHNLLLVHNLLLTCLLLPRIFINKLVKCKQPSQLSKNSSMIKNIKLKPTKCGLNILNLS